MSTIEPEIQGWILGSHTVGFCPKRIPSADHDDRNHASEGPFDAWIHPEMHRPFSVRRMT